MNKLYINSAAAVSSASQPNWTWPVDPATYDRRPELSKDEIAELAYLARRQRPYGHFPTHTQATLRRLMDPLDEVMTAIRPPQQTRSGALTVLLVEMHRRGRAYWGWTSEEWMEILRPSSIEFHDQYRHTNRHTRHMLAAALYLLRLFDDFRKLGIIDRTALACRIFGRSRVQDAIQRVVDLIRSWGYGRYEAKDVQWAVCTALIANKSPRLEDLSLEVLAAERSVTPISYRRASIVCTVPRAN